MRFSVPNSHTYPRKRVFEQQERIKSLEIGSRIRTVYGPVERQRVGNRIDPR
jgi:hypothetical protein